MKKISNRIYGAIILIFLLISLIYISDIMNLPDNIILFEGEALNLKTIFGVDIKTSFSSNPNIERIENYETITVSSNVNSNMDYTGRLDLDVLAFGVKVKEINVDIIESSEVIPLGSLIGVKLYTNGVLVVGMSDIVGIDMERYKPYENSGILEGDIIVEVNQNEVTCTSDLTNYINASRGENMLIKYIRDGNIMSTNMKAIKTNDNSYKIGLWVRDTAAGVGTATFYEPSSKKFASLGHGIVDNDTEELVEIASGEIVTANILSVAKGNDKNPGKIQGTIEGRPSIRNYIQKYKLWCIWSLE